MSENTTHIRIYYVYGGCQTAGLRDEVRARQFENVEDELRALAKDEYILAAEFGIMSEAARFQAETGRYFLLSSDKEFELALVGARENIGKCGRAVICFTVGLGGIDPDRIPQTEGSDDYVVWQKPGLSVEQGDVVLRVVGKQDNLKLVQLYPLQEFTPGKSIPGNNLGLNG